MLNDLAEAIKAFDGKNPKTNQPKQTRKNGKVVCINPAGTVEGMMSCASLIGLAWREKPKQKNKNGKDYRHRNVREAKQL